MIAGIFLIFAYLGRADLVLKSLYLIVPLTAASIFVIVKPGLFSMDAVGLAARVNPGIFSFQKLVLISTIVYIASICLLVINNERPPGYFILSGIYSALILVEILSCGEENTTRKAIILGQITLLAASFILGQTLRLPLYFGYGDIFTHMFNINTILDNGHISSSMLVDYQNFPVFHILGAFSKLVSGLDLQKAYFLFYGILFLVSIPLIYLIVSKLTKNTHLPLIATLVFSLNREVIFNGMYMITRVMAFILCFMILYLLIRGRTDYKLRILAIFLVIPLVLTHHTTLVHFSGILFGLVILEFFLYRPGWYVGFNFLVFFIIAYLGYWLWLSYPFFQDTLVNYATASDVTRVPLPAVESSALYTYSRNMDPIVVAFLAFIGIIVLFHSRSESNTMGTAFALFSIVALIFYFPVVNSFLNKILLTARLELLVSPFISFAAAGGILFLIGKSRASLSRWESGIRAGVGIILVFYLAMTSQLILGNSTDQSFDNVLGGESRQYFTQGELSSFSFAKKYRDRVYYGDYASCTYLRRGMGLSVNHTTGIIDPASLTRGSMLFRKEEFEKKEQLSFLNWTQTGEEELVFRKNDVKNLQAAWENEFKVYNSGKVLIYSVR